MEFVAGVLALIRRNLTLVEYTGEFCGLAASKELHDAAILHLFRLGANYHCPMDLPDTTGLCWREGIYRCLGSYRSRVETSPLVSPLAPPSSSSPPLVPSSSSSSPLVPSSSSSSPLVLPNSSSLVPPSSSSSPLVMSSSALPERPLVPLGLLVDYEGMVWSPALEPNPHQRPPVPASHQHPPVPAPRQRPPVPAPRQRPPVPAPRQRPPVPTPRSALKFLRWSCPAHLVSAGSVQLSRAPTRVRAARAPTRVRAARAPTRVRAARAPTRVRSRPSAHESQSRTSAPKSWSRPAHLCLCNPPGSTLPQLVGAGLEPGIPVREAGALTRNAKGYSL